MPQLEAGPFYLFGPTGFMHWMSPAFTENVCRKSWSGHKWFEFLSVDDASRLSRWFRGGARSAIEFTVDSPRKEGLTRIGLRFLGLPMSNECFLVACQYIDLPEAAETN
jgi:hypothetical protein